jgi:beta-glucanase (GH16 family)
MNKLIFIPFCVFIISIRLNAQPSIDNNWNSTPYFFDNFNPPRSAWDNINWMDDPNELKWKAHLAGTVTCSSSNRMVFQKENAIFNSSDSTIRLRSEYAGGLLDTSDYTIPTGMTKDPTAGPLYYKSGAICVGKSGMQTFLYGFFEIRCKLPVNRGAFPAFWLWNSTLVNSVRNYREIDIFEFCWNITTRINDEGTPRYFEGQIYYYNGAEPTTLEDYKYGNHGYYVPINEPDLSNWHTYGMEWSPKHVKWYFDNKLLKSYMGDSMPSLSMYLIINNSVNNDADLEGGGESTDGFPNNMVIDYLKVNKLKCDCNSNASIQNNTQLAAFNHKVYESITIGGYGSDINIPSNTHTVFRATDEITINGNFELPLGSSMELITHPCPQ